MHRAPRSWRARRQPRALAAGAALALLLAAAPTASAQFYEKVDVGNASAAMLRDSLSGEQVGTGAFVAGLSGLQDPALEPLFRAMAAGSRPGARVYGILGVALATRKGLDPTLVAGLTSPDERAAIVREANVSGILRDSPVDVILAQGNFSPAATLTLVGELHRRRAPWEPATILATASDADPVAAGAASLLLLAKGQTQPWEEYRKRLEAMPEGTRSETVRALCEAALIFEIKEACVPLLALATGPGISDDTLGAAIGLALRLDTPAGVEAWTARVAQKRSQAQLVRAGLQLLASADRGVPPESFDKIRNGNPVVEAIADTGVVLARKGDTAAALIKLLELGHPMSAEWALVRASDLPPEEGAKVWKHIAARLDDQDPANRPTGPLVAGLARELVKTDPAAVGALAAKVKGNGALEVAVLSGLYDARRAEAVPIASTMRGAMPRAGESIAVLLLAREGKPLTAADMDLLGRAGAGGGDLDAVRQTQAAWLFVKRSAKSADEAVARILNGPAPSAPAAPAAPAKKTS